jgi:hypothetical protein
VKKKLSLAASLAGVLMAASACAASVPGTSASATSASATSDSGTPPQSAETEAPSPATGWELNKQGGAARIKAAGLEVLNAEGSAEHFHAHLDVFVNGKAMIIPADIGFEFNAAGQPTGISALHTHDESGVIHVEAPVAGKTYTVGQLLTEWGVLDGTGPATGTAAHSPITGWSATVNGKKRSGSISSIVLKAHDEIVLYRGTAPSPMPSTFAFPAGE